MTSFWGTFFGGLASGVALLLLTRYIHRRVRRRSKGESVPALSMKELRPYLPLVVGLVLLLLGLFGGEEVAEFSDYLVGFGGMLMVLGSIWVAIGMFD